MKEKFLETTKKWYSYINQDHHKDRDCHWYIGVEKQYSYGRDAENAQGLWYAKHEGYLTDFWEHAETEDEAMQKATDFMETYMKENTYSN